MTPHADTPLPELPVPHLLPNPCRATAAVQILTFAPESLVFDEMKSIETPTASLKT